MTEAQRRALQQHWSHYGIEPEGWLDLDQVFTRRAERTLEIGFGMGDALIHMAAAHPEMDFLGVEVYEPGIGRLLNRLAPLNLQNVRVIRGDAVDVLRRHLRDDSLNTVLLWFPDPWPKKRHHKRRLVQPEFVSLVCAKLKPGGRFHLATDWQDYAQQMLALLEREPRLTNVSSGPRGYTPRPAERPMTKFERRGSHLGHPSWDLVFQYR